MKTLTDIKTFFRGELKPRGMTQAKLERDAGVAHQTIANILGGDRDFKVSTMLSVADRLGYEMVFVPKAAVSGIEAHEQPAVKTRVGAALEKINKKETK